MKKTKLSVITLLAVLLLLAGCGNKTAKISDGNDILIQFGDTRITKADLYYSMLKTDAGYTVINLANNMIANIEIETTDELITEVQNQVDSYKASLTDDWQKSLESLGFETEEELFEQLLSSLKANKLVSKYIDENFDTLVADHAPLMARMIYIKYNDNDIEKAKADADLALAEIKAGADFKTVAEKYSDSPSLADETLYTRYSQVDYNVLQFLLSVMDVTLSGPIENSNSSGIYIVQITKTNIEQIKESFINSLNKNEDIIADANNYYFTKHAFVLYDIKTYELIKMNYPSYLPVKE
jgi:predicted small secreted protein